MQPAAAAAAAVAAEADGHAFMSVLSLLLADAVYNRFCSPRGRGRVETPWWLVYVFSAPLLFSSTSPPAQTLTLILSLYATRFAVEALQAARGHWAVRVASSTRRGPPADLRRPAGAAAGPRTALAEAAGAAAAAAVAAAAAAQAAVYCAASTFSSSSSSSSTPNKKQRGTGAPVLSGFEIPRAPLAARDGPDAKAAAAAAAAAAALHGPELWPMSARWPPRLRVFRTVHPRVT